MKEVSDMSLRFRKSIKLGSGAKFNINKKSVGFTFGNKGMHYTINSSGRKTSSVGIPGTGLYYQNIDSTSNGKNNTNTTASNFSASANQNSTPRASNPGYNNYNSPNMNMNNDDDDSTIRDKKIVSWLLFVLFPPLGIALLAALVYKNKNIPKKPLTLMCVYTPIWVIVAISIISSGWIVDNSPQQVASNIETTSAYIEQTSEYQEYTTNTSTEQESIKNNDESSSDVLNQNNNEQEEQTNISPATDDNINTYEQESGGSDNNVIVREDNSPQPEEKIYVEKDVDYVLNTSTKKFHLKSCAEVKKIKSENLGYYTGKRTDVENMGYVACKKCIDR